MIILRVRVATPNEAVGKLLEGSQSANYRGLSIPPRRLIVAYRAFYEVDFHLRSSAIFESEFFYSLNVQGQGVRGPARLNAPGPLHRRVGRHWLSTDGWLIGQAQKAARESVRRQVARGLGEHTDWLRVESRSQRPT